MQHKDEEFLLKVISIVFLINHLASICHLQFYTNSICSIKLATMGEFQEMHSLVFDVKKKKLLMSLTCKCSTL